MIIIDSSFHLVFSSTNKLPEYACVGKCKKVWWGFDFGNIKDRENCHNVNQSLMLL